MGYDVGCRILELLSYREKQMRRKPEVLDILKHIHSVAWPYMFGKTADDLQQANAADDEYMISDNDLLVGKFISIPKSYSSFVPGSLVAGIVRGMLDTAGFPARWAARKTAADNVAAVDFSVPWPAMFVGGSWCDAPRTALCNASCWAGQPITELGSSWPAMTVLVFLIVAACNEHSVVSRMLCIVVRVTKAAAQS